MADAALPAAVLPSEVLLEPCWLQFVEEGAPLARGGTGADDALRRERGLAAEFIGALVALLCG